MIGYAKKTSNLSGSNQDGEEKKKVNLTITGFSNMSMQNIQIDAPSSTKSGATVIEDMSPKIDHGGQSKIPLKGVFEFTDSKMDTNMDGDPLKAGKKIAERLRNGTFQASRYSTPLNAGAPIFKPSKNFSYFDLDNDDYVMSPLKTTRAAGGSNFNPFKLPTPTTDNAPLDMKNYVSKEKMVREIASIEKKYAAEVKKYKKIADSNEIKQKKIQDENKKNLETIISKHQQQTDDLLKKKEEKLFELQKGKNEVEGELSALKDSILKEKDQKREKDGEDDDVAEDMKAPVDPFDFETTKNQRTNARSKVVEWIQKY